MKSAKLWLGMLLAGWMAGTAAGSEITLEQAETAAGNWLARGGAFGVLEGGAELSGETMADPVTGAQWHVVKVGGEGIVVMPTDDRIEPVLAFLAGNGDGTPDPGHPFWALVRADIAAREQAVEEKPSARRGQEKPGETLAREKWAELLEGGGGRRAIAAGVSGLSDVRVEPLLVTQWGQTTTYANETCWNYYTPNHDPCGCNATAMAQIMRYWKKPSGSVSAKSYACKVDGTAKTLSMKGGTYNWNLMPNTWTSGATASQREAVGKLAYDAAVTLATIWTDYEGVSCLLEMMPALKSDFGYSSAVALEYASGYYNWSLEEFKKAVIPNLDRKCPVGVGLTGDGSHTAVADGYGYSGGSFYIHVNFGWYGSSDAWYCPPDVHRFTSIYHVLCNVFPSETGNILSGRVTDSRGVAVAGATVKLAQGSTSVGTATTDGRGIYSFATTKTGSFTVTATYGGNTASCTGRLGSTTAVKMTSERSGAGLHYATKCAIGNSYGNDLRFKSAVYQTSTVTLDRQGGTGGAASVTATYGSAMPSILVPTRAGYSFGGYWTGTGGTGTQYYTASGTSARTWDRTGAATLYAKWTAGTSLVTLDRQGGTGGAASVTATYGSALPSILVPTRAGYGFGGYWTGTGGTGTQYYTASGTGTRTWDRTGAATLYAQWTPARYTVTLDPQGGTGGTASVAATYGEQLPSVAVPQRSGFDFAGYFSGTGGSGTQYYNAAGQGVRTWNTAGNSTLYAHWTEHIPTTVVDGVVYNADMTTLIRYPVDKQGSLFVVPATVTNLAAGCFVDTQLRAVQFQGNAPAATSACFSSGLLGYCTKGTAGWTTGNADAAWGARWNGLRMYPIPEGGVERVREMDYRYEIVDGIVWVFVATNGEASLECKPRQSGGWGGGACIPWGVAGEVVVPSALGGCPVARIGSEALGYGSYTSVVIPHTVGVIESSAFCYSGSQLKSVTIPNSVTNIDAPIFIWSSGLEEILVESGNPCYESDGGVLYTLGKGSLLEAPPALAGHFDVPGTVTNIGFDAFYSCNVTSIMIPDSVVTIGCGEFFECDKLERLEVPGAWYGTDKLTDASVPSGCEVVYRGIEALAVATENLPEGLEGERYEASLAASGGISPYAWRVGAQFYTEASAAGSYAETGTAQGWREDDDCWDLVLPFAFPFHGNSYTNAKIGSNGLLSFGGGYCDDYIFDEDTFSHGPIIAVLWNDLTTADGDIHVAAGTDAVTVQWRGSYCGGGAVNVAATLHKDGKIVLSYGAGNEKGGAIGISAGDGITAQLSAKSSSGSMANADDIVFLPGAGLPGWLELTPGGVLRGTPDTAGEYPVTVVVEDSKGVTAGRGLVLTVEQLVSQRVVFDANGGICAVAERTVDVGAAYPAMPVPEWAGHAFLGWYTAASGGARVDAGMTVPAVSVRRLYAHWTTKQTVSFDPNGGSCTVAVRTNTIGSAYGELPVPKRSGNVFLGWFTLPEGGMPVTAESLVTLEAARTLHAHWSDRQVTTFDGNGGSPAAQTTTNTIYAEYGTFPEVSWQDHAFLGWFTAREGGKRVYTNSKVTLAATRTLYAHWQLDLAVQGDFHVDAATGSDANSGRSWAEAKASIQAAIDAAEDGDRIAVYDGVYEPIETVTYSWGEGEWTPTAKALEIVSVNGAEKTVIDGSPQENGHGWSRGAYLGLTDWNTSAPTGPQAVLDGFTIRGVRSSGGIGAGALGGILRRCIVTDNRTEGASGGGVADATCESCTISGNKTDAYGGGAYNCTLVDCTVENNEAEANGGGTAGCRMQRCIVRNNRAGGYGGAMVRGLAEDCLIEGNEAALGGGAVAGAYLSRCTVVDNRTDGTGGAASGAVLHGSILWNNTAGEGDGNCDAACHGAYNDTTPLLPGPGNISADPQFSDAPSGDYRLSPSSPCIDAGFGPGDLKRKDLAGEVRWQGAHVDMGAYETASSSVPCFVSGNLWVDAENGNDANSGTSQAEALASIMAAVEKAVDGATIHVRPGSYGPFTLDGRTLALRSTAGAERTIVDGGGVAQCAWMGLDRDSVLEGFTLANGYVPSGGGGGGGVFGGTLRGCILRNNTSGGGGGGACEARLERCILQGNAALDGLGGGAVFCDLANCLVQGNTACDTGGGVFIEGNSIGNCTIVGNSATGTGGGVAGTGQVANSIVWGNFASDGPDISGCEALYVCSGVLESGEGNIAEDPLFADAASGDYRLSASSPCIDAGADEWAAGETDLDNNARIFGGSVDLGAYEWNSGPIVRLDSQGGKGGTASVIVHCGAGMPPISVPSRAGYGFEGYFSEKDGQGTQYYSGNGESVRAWDIPESTTLFAYWRKIQTVTFDANGGSCSVSSQEYRSPGTYGTLPQASRSGHAFLGWFTAAEGGKRVTETTAVTTAKARTLWAHWTDRQTTTFKGNGGTPRTQTTTNTIYAKYGELPTATRSGHVLAGWYTAAEGGKRVYTNSTVTLAGERTLYAQWTDQQVVTFKGNGGTPSTQKTTNTIYAKYGTFPAVEWTNHVFLGWYTAANAADGKRIYTNSTVTLAAARTLYAQWTDRQVVTFIGNGGTPETQKTTNTMGTAYGTLPTPKWSGHVFLGWFTEAEGGAEVQGTDKVTAATARTLYAHWTDKQVTVFKGNGGTPATQATTNTIYADYGVLPTAKRSGQALVGWFTAPEGGKRVYTNSTVTLAATRTLYAQWTDRQVTTFKGNGGTPATQKTTNTIYAKYGTFPAVTWTNHVFLGWYTAAKAADGKRIYTNSTVTLSAARTLYAQWTDKQVVTFKGNGGTPETRMATNTMGTAYGTLPTPKWSGHVFLGWFTEVEGGDEVAATDMATAATSRTLWAHWTDQQVTTFIGNGGTPTVQMTTNTIYAAYGELPTAKRSGQALVGWFNAPEGGKQVYTNSTVTLAAERTLYAHWTDKQVTTFKGNGGTPATQKTTNAIYSAYGALPTATWSGHVFQGWYNAAEGGKRVYTNSTVTLAAARTLYAHWTTAKGFAITAIAVGADGGQEGPLPRALHSEDKAENVCRLRFELSEGTEYEIQWTASLDGEWETVERLTAESDGEVEVEIEVPGGEKGFFRLVAFENTLEAD